MGGNGRGAFEYSYWIASSLLLMCCLKACNCTINAAAEVNGCIEGERKALLQFKAGVIDESGMLSSWGNTTGGEDDDDCCQWRGVECDNHTGHVISVDVHGDDVLGEYLGGKIVGGGSPSLAELQHLKRLNLSWNEFEGNLPPQLGSFSNLKFLDLRSNYLEGNLPAELGNLTNLLFLDLSGNNFQGRLPAELGNLSNLQYLDLSSHYGNMSCENLDWISGLPLLTFLGMSGINLRKAIHWPEAITKMASSLTYLLLSHTQLPPVIDPRISTSPTTYNSSSTYYSLAVLDLSDNGLTSSIYPWLFNSFMNNTRLVYLDLSYNDLGNPIPDAFGNLDTLEILDLSVNQLHGAIPDSFGNMTSLIYLDLSWNQLEGDILKSLRALCNLQTSQNNLTGLLEKDCLACSSNKLRILRLSHNRFSGPIPDLSGFSQLMVLDLGSNRLNGTLPESIGRLAQLTTLSIPSNSLQGTVLANQLFGLSKLSVLDLSFNSLTINITHHQVPKFRATEIMLGSCKLGPQFPNWLRTQRGVQKVVISSNGITDTIPTWFWNLSSKFVWLNFSNNHISGTLSNIQVTPRLGMDMSSNFLQGSIPQSLFNAGWLDLSNNLFSGSLSLSCGTSNKYSGPGLSHLDLSNNRLSGELPNCWEQWKDLIVLNLANNSLSGKIKSSIGLLYQIQSLHLRNNSLIGALPSSLKKCKDLHLIDLGRNKLSGDIPPWIGRYLTSLTVLNLRFNEFNGSIPLSLCQLKKIQTLDLSMNNLSGPIPRCLNNLVALTDQKGSSVISYSEGEFNSGWNYSYIDDTRIQWKGKESEYKKTLGLVRSIDLSSNELMGEIPMELTDLIALVSLNLSRNHLTGSIPSTIGQLKSLDSLDLSQNHLHGEIPTSLSQIDRLSVLDLSNNSLSGEIPSSTQLQSFKAAIYEGNPGLCGPPLLEMCPKDDEDDQFKEASSTGLNGKKDANYVWFSGNIALGFITGFWGVCGTLLLNRSWRNSYFNFLSKIKDRLQQI